MWIRWEPGRLRQLLLELKAGNWLKAAKLAAEIIHDELEFTPTTEAFAYSAFTNEELVNALQVGYDAAFMVTHSDYVKALLPLLMEILKRYLGGCLSEVC